tara:strand:- start:2113 stop:2826 length:714 start_codon:yes stop_codon:yes gene_type:complete
MNTKVSIIIPCYNEKNSILEIVKKINSLNISKQIILIDDYSVDGTRTIIDQKIKNIVDKVILHEKNEGKGACIISAIPYIIGDIVIIQDADLEYDPDNYDRLIKPLIENKSNVVYGSRVLNKNNYLIEKNFISNFRIFGNYILTKISNIINNQTLTDAHTCYKVFKKDIFFKMNLKENGFNFCPEVTTKLSILNENIIEVPINYKGRSVEEGKKIRFWHAIEAVITILKYKFFTKND